MWKIMQSWFQSRKEEEIPAALKLLKNMVKIEEPPVDPMKHTEYNGMDGEEIYFEHKSIRFVDKINLNSIRYIRKDGYGYHRWKASFREYEQVYHRSDVWGRFLEGELRSMVTYLDEKKDEAFYQYIMDQHYQQILLVSEAIKEIKDLEGYVPDDVAEKCIQLLRDFFTEIKELKGKYKQDILRKLTEEIEYLDGKSQSKTKQIEDENINKVVKLKTR